MEKKPRTMLINYSQNAFPRSINEVRVWRAWDTSPEQHMETSEELPKPSPAPTGLPPCLLSIFKTVLQSTIAWVPTKTNIPFRHLLPFKLSSNPKSGGTSSMCIMVSVQHSSVIASLGMGRRELLTGEGILRETQAREAKYKQYPLEVSNRAYCWC